MGVISSKVKPVGVRYSQIRVDVIASGYEWWCPKCERLNKEIECTTKVTCGCGWQFRTELPEHAYQ